MLSSRRRAFSCEVKNPPWSRFRWLWSTLRRSLRRPARSSGRSTGARRAARNAGPSATRRTASSRSGPSASPCSWLSCIHRKRLTATKQGKEEQTSILKPTDAPRIRLLNICNPDRFLFVFLSLFVVLPGICKRAMERLGVCYGTDHICCKL